MNWLHQTRKVDSLVWYSGQSGGQNLKCAPFLGLCSSMDRLLYMHPGGVASDPNS